MSPHISIKHRESELSICGATSFWSSQAPGMAPGMAPVYTSLLASDICQEKHENIVIKVPKNL